MGVPLTKYVNGKIYRGIITGLNKAFVVDYETKQKLIEEDEKSKELLKPFLAGRDIKRYLPVFTNNYLIFTKRSTNIKDYPAIENYLKTFKEELIPKPRNWKGKEWKGRKPGSYAWYEIQDTIDYYKEFEKPKIIYPNICKRNEFTFDSNNFYTNQKCFIISIDDKYLLGLLNSCLFYFLFRSILPKLRGGFYEPGYVFLKDFPIADTDNKEIKALVSSKAEEILKLNEEKQKVKIPQEKTTLQRQIEAADKQIDQLVYQIYGLTDEEIKIVEGE